MAKSYVGKAPLTLVRANGAVAYVYEGQPAPEGIDRDDLKRLVDEDFLVEAEEVVQAGDEDGDDGPQRPAQTANKDVWIDFRVTESDGRLSKEQLSADGITKANLQDDAYVAALPAAQS